MADDGYQTTPAQSGKPHIRSAIGWTTVLSVVLAPLVVVGPFIAGYVGGRRAKTAAGALVATLGPALIWTAVWWWLSNTQFTLGHDKITPPAELSVLAPTTGLAILGGAFAGSGGRLAHVIGCAVGLIAAAWLWRDIKPLYAFYNTVIRPPASGPGPQVAENKTCPDRLKKLYDAVMLYSDSWDGQLPPADHWMSALRDPSQTFGEEEYLHCPDVSTGAGPKYGYAMNRELGGKRIGEIKDRAATPLFFDTEDLTLNANAATPPTPGRHAGKSNVVFADGHLGQQ